jgi:hypothetical protein
MSGKLPESPGLHLPHVRPPGAGVYQLCVRAPCRYVAPRFRPLGQLDLEGGVSNTYSDTVFLEIAHSEQVWIEGEAKLFTAEGVYY